MSQPHENALVVRGGETRDPSVVTDNLKQLTHLGKPPILSVFADTPLEGEKQEQCVLRICTEANIKNGKVQVAPAGMLLSAGFDLVHKPENGVSTHYNVSFTVPVQHFEVQTWLACFGEPIPNGNPNRKTKGRVS